ncbi:SGNH/GDSL hydrolase family protein [Rhizobium leguminosarum]
MKLIPLLFSLLLLASQAFAQAGPVEPLLADMRLNRDNYGRVIFMFGDSIMRGYALGFFPDSSTKEQMNNPNWELRSPASQLRSLGHMAVYAGLSGQPDRIEDGVEAISSLIGRRVIRDGDVIVLEDAGLHGNDPVEYFNNWLKLGEATKAANITLIMLTVPDDIKAQMLGGDPADLYRYSVEFGSASFNSATVFAAHTIGARLIDYNTMMEKVMKTGKTVLHDDGIHPNLDGQTILVNAIIQECTEPYTGMSAMR